MTYAFYRFLAFVIRAMPRALAHWIGLRLCDAAYFLNRRARAAVEENLRTVWAHEGLQPSDDHAAGCARKTFQYFGKYAADFIRFREMPPDRLRRFVSVAGLPEVEKLRATGRGGILLTLHYGNWELGGAVFPALGFKVHAVVQPVASPPMERIYTFFRRQRGMDVIPLARASTGIVRALRRGDLVAMVGDRDFTGTGLPHDFMGRPATLPHGAAWFAHKLGVPILFGAVRREPDDTYAIRLAPLITPEEYPSEAAIQDRLVALMEQTILSDPCQWFTFYPFWRTTPAAAAHPGGRTDV